MHIACIGTETSVEAPSHSLSAEHELSLPLDIPAKFGCSLPTDTSTEPVVHSLPFGSLAQTEHALIFNIPEEPAAKRSFPIFTSSEFESIQSAGTTMHELPADTSAKPATKHLQPLAPPDVERSQQSNDFAKPVAKHLQPLDPLGVKRSLLSNDLTEPIAQHLLPLAPVDTKRSLFLDNPAGPAAKRSPQAQITSNASSNSRMYCIDELFCSSLVC